MCPVAAMGKAYQVDFEGPKVLKSVGITHTHQVVGYIGFQIGYF